MIYAKRLVLPSEYAEINFVKEEKRTCFNTFYPFNIFPNKALREVDFAGITLYQRISHPNGIPFGRPFQSLSEFWRRWTCRCRWRR